MKEIKSVLIAGMVFMLTPFVITMLMTGVIEEDVSENLVEMRRVRVTGDRASLGIDISRYIAGVLAARLQYSESVELLKAEAIMIRTEIYRTMGDQMTVDDSALGMNYLSEKERKALWGNAFEEKAALIADCIRATDHCVLSVNGALIGCPYTVISAGKTRSGEEVYPGGNVGYLASCDCSQDMQAPEYLTITAMSYEEFAAKLIKKFDSEEIVLSAINPMESVQIVARDKAEYVLSAQVGNLMVSGEELAEALGLSSPSFIMENVVSNGSKKEIKITTKGKGSGFGISLYTAHQMAESGKSYEEILKYFYKGISIINE